MHATSVLFHLSQQIRQSCEGCEKDEQKAFVRLISSALWQLLKGTDR